MTASFAGVVCACAGGISSDQLLLLFLFFCFAALALTIQLAWLEIMCMYLMKYHSRRKSVSNEID